MIQNHLTNTLFKQLLDQAIESNSISIQNKKITHVDDVDDERIKQLRKLDLSFNLITNLKNITCQIPQLRHLSAYCCQLHDIDDLNFGTYKIEHLHLQQNGITAIPRALQNYTKLRELRLDQNKLISVNYLSFCVSLQILNVGYNKLQSIDGIEGLQSLQILILRNNHIKTISTIKLLPSLKELDISNNQLQTLEGVNNLPMLEIIRADGNHIHSLVIPTIYSYHERLNKTEKLEKSKVEGKEKGKSQSNTSLNSNQKGKEKCNTQSKQSLNHDNNGSNSNVSYGTTNASSKSQITGMHHLTELYLSNNKLETLIGFENYGNHLEVIDISNNLITDEAILYHIFPEHVKNPTMRQSTTYLPSHEKLSEFRFEGNPFLSGDSTNQSKSTLMRIIRSILPYAPNLSHVNTYTIKYHPHVESSLNMVDKSISSSSLISSVTNEPIINYENRNFTLVYNDNHDNIILDFHTWENEGDSHDNEDDNDTIEEKNTAPSLATAQDDTMTMVEKSNETSNQSNNKSAAQSNIQKKKNKNRNGEVEVSDQSDDEDNDDDESNDIEYQKSKTISDRLAPKLHLKNMKSIEEILEKETIFRNLLQNCRRTLANITTVTPTSKQSSTTTMMMNLPSSRISTSKRGISSPLSSPVSSMKENTTESNVESMNTSVILVDMLRTEGESMPGSKKSPISARDYFEHTATMATKSNVSTAAITAIVVPPSHHIHAIDVVDKSILTDSLKDHDDDGMERLSTVIVPKSKYDANTRMNDPGLQLLQQRLMDQYQVNKNSRRSSHSAILSTSTVTSDVVGISSTCSTGNTNIILDNHSISSDKTIYPSERRPLSASTIANGQNIPKFSIGFDVRLQRFQNLSTFDESSVS